MGDMILADLTAEGVHTDLAQRTPGARSSYSAICVDASGERMIVNFPGEGLSNDTDWIAYEDIQADLFDRILAMVSDFGLRVFQDPSGSDIAQLGQSTNHESGKGPTFEQSDERSG